MKDKKKHEPEIDFEMKYYQAMQENILMKEKAIDIKFTDEEITFLKSIMYEEMLDMKYDIPSSEDEDDTDEKKMLSRSNKSDFLDTIIDERRVLIERITKKLRFEI